MRLTKATVEEEIAKINNVLETNNKNSKLSLITRADVGYVLLLNGDTLNLGTLSQIYTYLQGITFAFNIFECRGNGTLPVVNDAVKWYIKNRLKNLECYNVVLEVKKATKDPRFSQHLLSYRIIINKLDGDYAYFDIVASKHSLEGMFLYGGYTIKGMKLDISSYKSLDTIKFMCLEMAKMADYNYSKSLVVQGVAPNWDELVLYITPNKLNQLKYSNEGLLTTGVAIVSIRL